MTIKRKFLITFIISSIVFSFVFINLNNNNFFDKEDNPVAAIGEEDKDQSSDDIVEETEKIKPKNKDEIVFLLLGLDTYDISKASRNRTDTMILTSYSFKTGDINMLSIPRDTKVKIKGELDQINHAHAFGGIDLTLDTVRDFLNVDVEHFVKVDYKAVKEIVDAIDGVEFDIPRRMKYDDTTKGQEFHVDLQPGLQILDGDQSIQLLRWRKNNDGTQYPDADVGRVKTQQMFMKELVKQTLKPKNILKIDRLAKTYFDYVDTNIPLDTVLKAAWSARKVDIDNMVTSTIPGEGDGRKYYIYDREELDIVLADMFGEFLIEDIKIGRNQ
ncbi:MAG TPA: LCP family protein [Tissierellaceae bacterium]|nr:LCP family protein [Tissierellaceae bacterium]